ncbi:MAG: trypsin-like peptidase domain-containing protein [Anaerolineae bacterium]|nr:trypsin-like peptidase domain-containing protein [Anaerolineae bacterium]
MKAETDSTPASEFKFTTPRFRNWTRQTRYIGLFAIGIVAALLGVLLYNTFFPQPAPLNEDDITAQIVAAMASATPEPANSMLVYQYIQPSLVFIQIQTQDENGEDGYGIGSGVVINESGEILTANHVVVNADEIEVYFADGTKTTAVIIASDPENDIAVLQPDKMPEIIVPAVLGSAAAMRVGDEAYAVGNPLGLTGSMSAGVISGFNRSVPIEEDFRLEGLIQFDAAVNPGNSGGPLLNRAGQVIGIVTALANPNNQDSFTGIGFAVPIGTAVATAGGGGPSY